MTLKVGDKLPAFTGVTADGALSTDDLKGSNTILYFYPKDSTPGCTVEACAFRDNHPHFKKMNAKIYGISKDNLKSHAKFTDKFRLPFPLISDADGSICEAFGTWVQKSMMGRKYIGIERATFLADEKGIIRQIWREVKARGHAEEVLAAVKALG